MALLVITMLGIGKFVMTGVSHELGSWLLLALIILHLNAAMYHQLLKKDSLLARMWFGK